MLTIKQLSEDLHLSKTAVSNRINELGLKDKLIKDGNKHLVPNDVADAVRDSFQQKRKAEPASAHNTDIIDLFASQLAQKDKQIEYLLKQIEQLQTQNNALLQTVQQGNYLLANTLGVADPEQVDRETEQTETIQSEEKQTIRSFFRKMFR